MGASDPPPEHHSGVLEFCGGMMLNKLQNGNEGTTLIKEDRISHLPDHILGEILAFIPLKDAVATSVLSRRWRRVFTWVTYLNLDDTPNCHDYCLMRTPHTIDSFPNFKMYVDKVLQLCHSNNMDISTYILHFGKRKDCFHNVCFEGCLPVLDPMHLDAWISFPLACGVKVLDIIARVRKPSKIPSALYRCPTLEVLKLDVNVNNLDLNISFRIHLPNLKVIHLTFLKHTPNDDSVAMLVASCPSLQDLVLNAECFININLITSQSLRRLVINFSGNTWIDITSFTTKRLPRREFELDVPNLEHLTYVDSAVVIYSITKMNNLVNAQVDVTDLYFDGSIFGIFSGLSNVQSLYLMSRTTNTMALMACGTIINLKLPLFGNLKHLQLGCEGYYNWNNVLIELLHRAPFLETLTFMEGIMMDNDVLEERYREIFLEECEAWSKSEEIPSCLRVQLKRITIYNYYCTQWEMEVVKYFLRNSFVLEELILICFSHPSFSVTKEAKMLLDNTLKLMRRRSTSCSIIFFTFFPFLDFQEMIVQEKTQASSSVNDDIDLDELMDDPELEKLHAERIAALQKEAEKRQKMKNQGHGEYRDITEGDFLGEVTGSELVICHFYHREFYRCKIMDKHLKALAPKYLGTKFLRLDAENAPFFISKLGIKTLPCVILFKKGIAGDRLVGFQDLGAKDDFPTKRLENLLIKKGIIKEKEKDEDEDDYSESKRTSVRSSLNLGSDSD